MKNISFWLLALGSWLLLSCVDTDERSDTPTGNFEALWQIIDEHYCFFDYKQKEYGLNWNTQRVTDNWYNASLFDNETGRALPALYELKNFSEGSAGLSHLSVDGFGDGYWYTIDGIRSLSGPSRSGLYIHNGQKVTIR